jgi:hypothetical protein
MGKIGKSMVITINSYISFFGMILFAIAFYMKSKSWFIGLSCLGRLL